MMNRLKKLMLFRLLILVIQLKKLTSTQKLKYWKKIPNHNKYTIANEFDKLTEKNFAERLKQANLACKNDIADFVKNTNFDEKLLINK